MVVSEAVTVVVVAEASTGVEAAGVEASTGVVVAEAAGAEASEAAAEAVGADGFSLLQAAKNKDIRAAAANKDFFMIMYLNLYQKVLL